MSRLPPFPSPRPLPSSFIQHSTSPPSAFPSLPSYPLPPFHTPGRPPGPPPSAPRGHNLPVVWGPGVVSFTQAGTEAVDRNFRQQFQYALQSEMAALANSDGSPTGGVIDLTQSSPLRPPYDFPPTARDSSRVLTQQDFPSPPAMDSSLAPIQHDFPLPPHQDRSSSKRSYDTQPSERHQADAAKKSKCSSPGPSAIDPKLYALESDATSGSSSQAPPSKLDLEEDLSCPICCDLFVMPVNFPCGHAFCGSCARRWLEKECVCPTCRARPSAVPARMYALDAILEKYFHHQLHQLRTQGKISEALAMELDRQEKIGEWQDRMKAWQAQSRAQAALGPSHVGMGRHPVPLPQMGALGGFDMRRTSHHVGRAMVHDRYLRAPHLSSTAGWPTQSQALLGNQLLASVDAEDHGPRSSMVLTTFRPAQASSQSSGDPRLVRPAGPQVTMSRAQASLTRHFYAGS